MALCHFQFDGLGLGESFNLSSNVFGVMLIGSCTKCKNYFEEMDGEEQ